MGIQLNGTTGYLQFGDKILSGPVGTLLVYSAVVPNGSDCYVISQSQNNLDRWLTAAITGNFSSKYAAHRNVGGGPAAINSNAVTPNQTAYRVMAAVFNGTSSRTMYYGNATGVIDTTTAVDDIANHNRFTIGAITANGNTVGYCLGDVAEAHVFNVALTSTDIANLMAGTVKPEEIAGWVDGWTLANFQAGGSYVSMGGTRTLTAFGGVSAGTVAHPINRTVPDSTAPTQTGTITVGTVTTTSIQITWPAGADNIGVTSYETSLDGTSWTDRGNTLTHTFTGLTASTSYTPRVRAKDAAGNVSTPALQVTQSTAAADSVLPTLTGALTASNITGSSYTLTWPAGTDNIAVTSYERSLDGGTTWADIGNVLTINVTGRTSGATDQTRVRAKDAAGNVSTPALSAAVTLLSSTGTVVGGPIVNNTGTVLANLTIPKVSFVRLSDMTVVLSLTNQTTNGSGMLSITNGALVPGTAYLRTLADATGATVGIAAYAAV